MFSEITPRLAVASAFDSYPLGWEVLDVRGMIDGPGNSITLIEGYITRGIEILRNSNHKLLVVCDYGQSRSNLVAAFIFARLTGTSIEESRNLVAKMHPESGIHPGLINDTRRGSRTGGLKRVAITGGNGFLGRRLSAALMLQGYAVHSLSRREGGEYLRSSSSVFEVLRVFQPDVVIHLAHPKPYNAEESAKVAFSQLVSVATYCQDHAVRLLYPSSWVVFDGSGDAQVGSSSPTLPHSRYGRLKVACEGYLGSARESGLDVRIVRLPGVFGADSLEPRFLRYFAECVRTKSQIIFHQFENGSARVPLVAVDDCAVSFAKIMDGYERLPLIFHLATREQVPSVGEIAGLVAETAGIFVQAAPVARRCFNGNFLPDVEVPCKKPVAEQVMEFVRRLF